MFELSSGFSSPVYFYLKFVLEHVFKCSWQQVKGCDLP